MADETTTETLVTGTETTETTDTTETTQETTQDTTETTTETTAQPGDETTDQTTDETETPAERVVPEAADYKLPEGAPSVIGEFANKNGFTQEQLDATIEHFGGYVKASEQVKIDSMRKAGGELIESWGENGKYNMSLAKKALRQNDPDGELSKALSESGYGNHPAVISFLFKLGSSMKEGGFLKGSTVLPKGKKTMAQKMFPNMHSTEA